MWIPFIAGWLLGSSTLYAYMVVTAKEPQMDECMDCNLMECGECPYESQANAELKTAA